MKIIQECTTVGAPPDAHEYDTSELMEQVQAVEMRAIKGGDYDLASLMGDVYWRLDSLEDDSDRLDELSQELNVAQEMVIHLGTQAKTWEQRAIDAGWGNPGGAYAEIERLRGLIGPARECANILNMAIYRLEELDASIETLSEKTKLRRLDNALAALGESTNDEN